MCCAAVRRAPDRQRGAVVLAQGIQLHVVRPLYPVLCEVRRVEHVERGLRAACAGWVEVLPVVRHVAAVCLEGEGAVWAALFAAMERVQPHGLAFRTLLRLWEELVAVFCAQIELWLVHGVVDDVRGDDFFIERQGDECRVAVERLPCFVSEAVADRILFAGNALSCSRMLVAEFDSARASISRASRLLSEPVQVTARLDRLFSNPESAALSMDSASLYWRRAAAEELSVTIPFQEIRQCLLSLRNYLLLGDALFWRCFFDELRIMPSLIHGRSMDENELEIAQRGLNQILGSVSTEFASMHSETSLHRSWSELPLSLKLSSSGDLIPQYTLSLAEGQLLADRASVYCDVFSIAFSIRRVACELRTCFSTLRFLDRLLRRKASRDVRVAVSAATTRLFALRLRMGNFIDGFDRYIQCDVVQEKFIDLLETLDNPTAVRSAARDHIDAQPFFDVVAAKHNTMLDKLFAQCFIDDSQINKRLQQIFVCCFRLCDMVAKLDPAGLQGADLQGKALKIESEFQLNVELLVKLLLHMQNGQADRTPALLLQIA